MAPQTTTVDHLLQTRTGTHASLSVSRPRSLTTHRCIALNAASLACGCAGNLFLLLNFTQKVRYIVALPMTIVLWYFATSTVRPRDRVMCRPC